MKVKHEEYYGRTTNEQYIRTGKSILEKLAADLGNNDDHVTTKLILEIGGVERHRELCALIGLAQEHPALQFEPGALVTIVGHEIGTLICGLFYTVSHLKTPEVSCILTLRTAICAG